MAKKQEEEFVTFEDSQGNVISNDPRYLAKKTLEEAGYGITFTQSSPEQQHQNLRQAAGVSDDEELGEDDNDKVEDYKTYDGAALKKLASARGVDISGMKKVGEVRKALMDDDAAKSANADAGKNPATGTTEDNKSNK